MEENWHKLIGKRILLKKKAYTISTGITEIMVLETSKSGRYVKFKYPSGNEAWEEPTDVNFGFTEILDMLDEDLFDFLALLEGIGFTVYNLSEDKK